MAANTGTHSFFLIWEVIVRLFNVSPWLLPAPSKIFTELFQGFYIYSEHLYPTIQLCIFGLISGVSIGIIIAILLHVIPFLRNAFYPLIIISQNIPIIVLAPLLVVWFGFGMLPKMIVIILVCFFPIAISLLDGFRQADNDIRHYLEMCGASKRQIFLKLEWPHALPSFFSGLKISATYSVMGAVISEWLGASKGIGVYMTLASSSFRIDRVFVAIILIVIISLFVFLLIQLIEKVVIRWNPKEEGK